VALQDADKFRRLVGCDSTGDADGHPHGLIVEQEETWEPIERRPALLARALRSRGGKRQPTSRTACPA
jgi:hypothetical protein